MPPAAVAWTSESGASESASTKSAQPHASIENPISQRRLPSRWRSDVSGDLIESGGICPTASCSSR